MGCRCVGGGWLSSTGDGDWDVGPGPAGRAWPKCLTWASSCGSLGASFQEATLVEEGLDLEKAWRRGGRERVRGALVRART